MFELILMALFVALFVTVAPRAITALLCIAIFALLIIISVASEASQLLTL